MRSAIERDDDRARRMAGRDGPTLVPSRPGRPEVMFRLAPTASRHVLPLRLGGGERKPLAGDRAQRLSVPGGGGLWEIMAHLGIFPPKLFPSLDDVAATFVRLTASGILPHHVLDTVLRLPPASRSPPWSASRSAS